MAKNRAKNRLKGLVKAPQETLKADQSGRPDATALRRVAVDAGRSMLGGPCRLPPFGQAGEPC
jgi:hypothetical protein